MGDSYKTISAKESEKDYFDETKELVEEQDELEHRQGEVLEMACDALREARAL